MSVHIFCSLSRLGLVYLCFQMTVKVYNKYFIIEGNVHNKFSYVLFQIQHKSDILFYLYVFTCIYKYIFTTKFFVLIFKAITYFIHAFNGFRLSNHADDLYLKIYPRDF